MPTIVRSRWYPDLDGRRVSTLPGNRCVFGALREATISTSEPAYRFFQREGAIDDLRNPLFAEVLGVWDQLRDGNVAPPWRVADMLRYPPAVIPFISVVDVTTDGEFRYRYWGTGHVDVKGYDYTGRSPRDHEPADYGRMINDEYRAVVEAAKPTAFVHDIRPGLAHVSKFQETLRLPLANDGRTVSGVISFADWRTNSSQWTEMFDTFSDTANFGIL
jgi:hypothetical protein